MSRSLWRCRHAGCSAAHGAVLGRLTAEGGLVLDPAVVAFRAYLDTRRVMVVCPACGTDREFRGGAVCSPLGHQDRGPSTA
ncbi:MAG: hypothetical protein M3R02_13975 [Chloroflexota bacterium]|nr:hypothetical protein [Chloroflexota bacterium]